MSTAMLNIRVVQPRMMSLRQAADYVGLSVKRFPSACPVIPISMPGDVTLYDVRDLDRWVDDLKTGSRDSDEEIIGKL
ncbi:hypothetical protein [Rhizobium sp. FY34]|uniref:hypothetical protein n=1 Tax=Rhizobium sp. FY34 TaxID=2562309 RepID=UPI001FEE2860|nr:hypothetical protein [Rhizobium sp. FY34]